MIKPSIAWRESAWRAVPATSLTFTAQLAALGGVERQASVGCAWTSQRETTARSRDPPRRNPSVYHTKRKLVRPDRAPARAGARTMGGGPGEGSPRRGAQHLILLQLSSVVFPSLFGLVPECFQFFQTFFWTVFRYGVAFFWNWSVFRSFWPKFQIVFHFVCLIMGSCRGAMVPKCQHLCFGSSCEPRRPTSRQVLARRQEKAKKKTENTPEEGQNKVENSPEEGMTKRKTLRRRPVQ